MRRVRTTRRRQRDGAWTKTSSVSWSCLRQKDSIVFRVVNRRTIKIGSVYQMLLISIPTVDAKVSLSCALDSAR